MIHGPKEIIRTTLGEFLSNGENGITGIYVIACYPTLGCVYVGKARNDILNRLREHLSDARVKNEYLGPFLRNNMADACGFRLDILRPPECDNADEWIYSAETALIEKFNPMLNFRNGG